MTFGELFLRLRKIMGVTQEEFGKLVGGAHQSAIARIENHNMVPRTHWFVRGYLLAMNDLEKGDLVCEAFDEFFNNYKTFYGETAELLSPRSPKKKRGPRGTLDAGAPTKRQGGKHGTRKDVHHR